MIITTCNTWWRHQMEAFSALLAHYAGNSPVTGEFPSQTASNVEILCLFDIGQCKLLSKRSNGRWSGTPWCSRDVSVITPLMSHSLRYFAFFVPFVHLFTDPKIDTCIVNTVDLVLMSSFCSQIMHNNNTCTLPNKAIYPAFCLKVYNIHRVTKHVQHYNDVIWARWRLKSPASWMFTQPFFQGADQRKHQRSASLAFVRGIHRWPVNSPHKGPVTRKMFPFDDVIMKRRQSMPQTHPCWMSSVWGLLNICSLLFLYVKFWLSKRTDEKIQITLVRCLRSSAAVTLVKYERGVLQATSILITLKNTENNGTEKIGLVTHIHGSLVSRTQLILEILWFHVL